MVIKLRSGAISELGMYYSLCTCAYTAYDSVGLTEAPSLPTAAGLQHEYSVQYLTLSVLGD